MDNVCLTKWGVNMPMIYSIRICRLFLLLLLLIVTSIQCSYAEEVEQAKKVLILYSQSQDFPSHRQFEETFINRLEHLVNAKVELSYEYLEMAKYSSNPAYAGNLMQFLREKYVMHQPDLVITYRYPAAKFIVQYGERIFPGVPAILTMDEAEGVINTNLPLNYKAVIGIFDRKKAVNLILQAQPSTEKIYVVIGNAESEKKTLAEFSKEAASFAGQVQFIYINQLSVPQMLETIKTIDGNSVILYFSFMRDWSGNAFIASEVLQRIYREARVPIYGTYLRYLNEGAVGGYMASGKILAQKAVEVGHDALDGHIDSYPRVEKTLAAEYAFNWKELKRWGIDEARLPVGSKIEFRQRTGWESYRWYIVSGIFIVLLEAVLILGLIASRIKQRRTEVENQKLEAELAQLDRINLVGQMAAGIGHEIRNPMTTVRGYLQMFQIKGEFTNYQGQIDTMIEELDRANSIITEFLSLAKNKAVKMKLGNLNQVVFALFPLLQADAFRRGHQLYAEYGTIPDSEFDEKEIRQLILNLANNAFEAMENSGEVTIRTYMENDRIVLAVRDTGTGISQDVLAKLGIPFVTTKEKGTGLGLPVCYRIAERHGAKITVDTGCQGTTFSVSFLPINA
jgi:signal transduction histidine kinase